MVGFGKTSKDFEFSKKRDYHGLRLTADEVIILTYHAMIISQLQYLHDLSKKLIEAGLMESSELENITPSDIFFEGVVSYAQSLQARILEGRKSEILDLLDVARSPFKFSLED